MGTLPCDAVGRRNLLGLAALGRDRLLAIQSVAWRGPTDDDLLPPSWLVLGPWLPPASGPGSRLTAEQLGRWIDETRLSWYLPSWPHLRRAAPQSLHDVRAARLQLAMALYQAEHPKKPFPTVQDLVPRYLPAALVDPLTGSALQPKSNERPEEKAVKPMPPSPGNRRPSS